MYAVSTRIVILLYSHLRSDSSFSALIHFGLQ